MEDNTADISDEDVLSLKLALLAQLDPFHKTRWMLDQISKGETMPEYCGLPVPISGERLVLEPRHPAASVYNEEADRQYQQTATDEDKYLDEHAKLVNSFYSRKKQCRVLIWCVDGKIHWGIEPAVHHFTQDVSTMGCSAAWSLEAEANAQKLLGELVTHYQMRCYLLTGMFLETSERSGVTYCFRRLRPTVALRGNKILTALCMHPIGYYADTWAGGLVPTDDVAAHLLLMRSDEHMFWRRSNQHPAWSNLAGL